MFTQHSAKVVSCFRERIHSHLRPIIPDAVKNRGKEDSEKTLTACIRCRDQK